MPVILCRDAGSTKAFLGVFHGSGKMLTAIFDGGVDLSAKGAATCRAVGGSTRGLALTAISDLPAPAPGLVGAVAVKITVAATLPVANRVAHGSERTLLAIA